MKKWVVVIGRDGSGIAVAEVEAKWHEDFRVYTFKLGRVVNSAGTDRVFDSEAEAQRALEQHQASAR